MGKQLAPPAEGWIQDDTTLLYHYYMEEPGMVAHRPLCEGPVLMTIILHRRAGELPQGLKARYAHQNLTGAGKLAGICKSCANRHANAKQK